MLKGFRIDAQPERTSLVPWLFRLRMLICQGMRSVNDGPYDLRIQSERYPLVKCLALQGLDLAYPLTPKHDFHTDLK